MRIPSEVVKKSLSGSAASAENDAVVISKSAIRRAANNCFMVIFLFENLFEVQHLLVMPEQLVSREKFPAETTGSSAFAGC
jgi:hypothetical protein